MVINVRNPQVKKIVRTIDNLFGKFYFNLIKNKQNEFFDNQIILYNSLPDKKTFKYKTLYNNMNSNNNKDWKPSNMVQIALASKKKIILKIILH